MLKKITTTLYIFELFILLIFLFSFELLYMTLNTLYMDYICNGITLIMYNYLSDVYMVNVDIYLNLMSSIHSYGNHIGNSYIDSMYSLDYNEMNNDTTVEYVNLGIYNITNLNFVKIVYTSHTLLNNLNFNSEVPYIYTENNVPTLLFYKLTNYTNKVYVCNSYYTVSPSNLSYYIIKQQCFCMEEFILNPNESLYLPILFYTSLEKLECTLLNLDYYLVGYANT